MCIFIIELANVFWKEKECLCRKKVQTRKDERRTRTDTINDTKIETIELLVPYHLYH